MTPPASETASSDGSARPEDEVRLPLMGHLGELRVRLKRALQGVLVGVVVAYAFSEQALWWLLQPVLDALRKLPGADVAQEPWLAVHNSLEYFFVLLRVSLYTGLFLAAPVVLYQLWAFAAPGLYRRERRLAAPFVILGSLFFIGGGLFARLAVLPFTMEYLVTTFSHPHVRQVFSIDAELDLVLASILAFGVIFELPLLLTLLAQLDFVSAAALAKYRRHAIVVNLILAAVITPTGDPFNLGLMAGPLIVCYELGILGARLVERRRKSAEAAAQA